MMRHYGLKLFLFVLVAAQAVCLGMDEAADRVIRNVEKRISSAKTMRVEFVESYFWELTGEEQSLEGVLILEDETRFRVTTEDQIIVSDGDTLWTYSIPSKRVLIDKLVKTDDALLPRQIFFRYTHDYRAQSRGEETIDGKVCHVIDLTSESDDVFIPRAVVWVDGKTWLPVKVAQTDLNGNQTIYLLHEIAIDVPVDAGLFRFDIPPDTEVIRMQ